MELSEMESDRRQATNNTNTVCQLSYGLCPVRFSMADMDNDWRRRDGPLPVPVPPVQMATLVDTEPMVPGLQPIKQDSFISAMVTTGGFDDC